VTAASAARRPSAGTSVSIAPFGPTRGDRLVRACHDPLVPDLVLGPIVELDGSRVLVGTCSWTDPTLVKQAHWYPRPSMSAAERLAFYAARYPIAEADSTYYFPPSPELCRSWVERTPPGFTMNVKAYSLLTGHPTKPSSLWPDVREAIKPEFAEKTNTYADHLPTEAVDEAWRRFHHAVAPLAAAGKLGAVLLQYPRWFTPKAGNRQELIRARERLGDLPLCVEFRAPGWLEPDDLDRTLGVLADHQLALVVVDAPAASHLPAVVAATVEHLAVVRFHGRADSTWSQRGTSAAERFRYLYERDELREWAPKLRQLAEQATEVHALMNNCYQDFGVRNARDLQEILAEDSGS
jgi:uncharacterized protein YecE (DUF72 family)